MKKVKNMYVNCLIVGRPTITGNDLHASDGRDTEALN
jgi:hypothetical protein